MQAGADVGQRLAGMYLQKLLLVQGGAGADQCCEVFAKPPSSGGADISQRLANNSSFLCRVGQMLASG
jgi:hypothetical protein